MRIGVQIGYCVLMLLGVWSMHKQTRLFRLGMILAVSTVIFTVSNIFYSIKAIELCANLAVLCFSVMSAVIAIKHVFGGTAVDRNMLFGAMCVYLLIGLIWAIVYGLIFRFWPGSFNGIENLDGTVTFDNLLYFSFVTLVGLGYGDITPVTPLARTGAYLEVVAGHMYMTIMMAGLVSNYISMRKVR